MERMDIIDHPEQAVSRNYAGFWIRVAAFIIDGVILNIVQYAISAIFGVGYGELHAGATTLNFLFAVLYETLFLSSSYQATPGKMAVGIMAITENGEKLSFLNAVGRYFAKILSIIILFIGVILVAFDSRKQGLHDKLAKTLVVYK